MSRTDEVVDGILQELRRGVTVLGVLSQLHTPEYGYSLVTILAEGGLSVDASSLYPLLRRLEAQGLLQSEWDTNEARPRKYYSLSPLGREAYARLCSEWQAIVTAMERFSPVKGEHESGSY